MCPREAGEAQRPAAPPASGGLPSRGHPRQRQWQQGVGALPCPCLPLFAGSASRRPPSVGSRQFSYQRVSSGLTCKCADEYSVIPTHGSSGRTFSVHALAHFQTRPFLHPVYFQRQIGGPLCLRLGGTEPEAVGAPLPGPTVPAPRCPSTGRGWGGHVPPDDEGPSHSSTSITGCGFTKYCLKKWLLPSCKAVWPFLIKAHTAPARGPSSCSLRH